MRIIAPAGHQFCIEKSPAGDTSIELLLAIVCKLSGTGFFANLCR